MNTTVTLNQEQHDKRLLHLSSALLVERDVRTRRNHKELAYYLVHETARVHQHTLAFLVRPKLRGWALVAATNVSEVEETSAVGGWLRETAVARTSMDIQRLETKDLSPPQDVSGGFPKHAMWMPLSHPDGGIAGVLLVLRPRPFEDKDALIAETLAECYGHALVALDDRPRLRVLYSKYRTKWLMGVAAATLAVCFWPVPMTALAPVEIVAKHTNPITAPFDGIVSEVSVSPYQAVEHEQVLVRMDQTELAMQHNVAKKALAVTIAELERFRHEAYQNSDSKAKLAIWELKVDLRRQELENAREKLEQHRIVAPSSGVVLYDHRFNWRGQPVQAGQRLMTVAKPGQMEAQIDLPVAGLIPLQQDADVTLFLDIAPSTPIHATLTSIGYQAQPTPAGGLAYRYRADFDEGVDESLLGARGTARLEGSHIPLIYSLLRRPIAGLRQFFGL